MAVSPIIKAQVDAMSPTERTAFLKAYPLDGYEAPPEPEAPAQAVEPDQNSRSDLSRSAPTTPAPTFQAGAEERLRWFFFGVFFVAGMAIAARLGG